MTVTVVTDGGSSARRGKRPGTATRLQPAQSPLPPAPPTSVAVVEGIATGAPEQVIEQADAAARVAALFDDPQQRARIPRVYAKTRVLRRHLAIDPTSPEFEEFGRRPATIRERMRLYMEHATPLAVDVAGRAIADAGVRAADVGLLVFVTSTGFVAPGVDVAIVQRLGLPRTVNRVVVNFMGCAAAMNGVQTASDYVRAHPDRKALVVCLELSSVNAVFGGGQRGDGVRDVRADEIITHSLFGDGCGALVVGASEVQHQLPAGRIVLRQSFSHLFDDAEDGIVLGVNDDGITCELAESLPQYIRRGVAPVVAELLAGQDLSADDIDLWAIHPGGPKIIDQSALSLGLHPSVADVSWDILAEYGNMLSVSLIFVLQEMARRAATSGGSGPLTGVAFSFAPGVTLEGVLFDLVRE
ncbi:3-oxoacyl-[acyl-carrier-protein] synthase III C-terminal domain-containing protein [Tsukamurella sp. 8F]|uniref:type III polyketide synthase n=1 Tax=unclassified Tsukamurella TaxID=2633480 RepID=UPI0023B93FDF|nr:MULTISPECIES: 3-oxoacyl-[acyl-carrier-protein] synthase III C-terminal domain-containing protein [unclassified Tsukamurella]MDF0529089.1 3-oxoacyl-[acyl-carrier-protein] synthase III C-terminal domain-containing protein [Tsukamurella sp. 8J]MDF0589012.1 3-oxoacyl-[acyl-carrier-protein] synthase III C-terminal domain-containing protein [Tsukamurella sp. 8F]